MPLVTLPMLPLIALICIAWPVIHIACSYLATRRSVLSFETDSALYRIRRWEQVGRFYQRWLHINRWKDRLPVCDQFFGPGFSKQRFTGRDQAYLRRFAAETRRAEWAHWIAIPPAITFFLWTPWIIGVCMIAYALLFNMPFLIIQRYNRARVVHLLDRTVARQLSTK